jgi:hypothetical protein
VLAVTLPSASGKVVAHVLEGNMLASVSEVFLKNAVGCLLYKVEQSSLRTQGAKHEYNCRMTCHSI